MFDWFSRGPRVDRTGGSGLNALSDGREMRLVLYKFDSCPACRRVFRAIDDLDVAIEYRDTRTERQWRADLMKRTGRTQVPCLFIDGDPMFESRDIAAWLREHFPASA